jgi:ADP-heptose:LPS heptosyltransferase
MHLIESYALTCGAMINSCFIQEEYIETPKQPYITLHAYNPKGPARQYKHWLSVINDLQNHDFPYSIIEIGDKHNNNYGSMTDYLGKTNYGQLAHLIKHSVLHLGFDSLPVHMASHFDKKIVAIYAHYAENTRPYFSTKENIVLLEPDHSVLKPIFANTDPFDQINSIPSSLISKSVLALLNII